MGLNWAGGFEGASKGLETVMGVKQKSIDMQYDDIVRKNKERTDIARDAQKNTWDTEKQADQQEFLSAEAVLNREQKAEEFEVRQADTRSRDEQTDTWRQLNLSIQEEGNRLRGEANRASAGDKQQTQSRLSSEGVSEEYQLRIDVAQEEADSFLKDPATREAAAAEVVRLQAERAKAMEYAGLDDVGRRSYEQATDFMSEEGDAAFVNHQWAMKYSKMPDEQRAQVVGTMAELQKQYPDKLKVKKHAAAAAIDKIHSESNPLNQSGGGGGGSSAGSVATPDTSITEEVSVASPEERAVVVKLDGLGPKQAAELLAQQDPKKVNSLRAMKSAGYGTKMIATVSEMLEPTGGKAPESSEFVVQSPLLGG
jgi:hypothetical protein